MGLFVSGKLFYKAGEGSGGGDSHNKGWYATLSDLTTAHPTASAGDWAIVGTTDTVWIWDTDNSAWVDSDQKGQVVSVNSKTGTVVLTAEDVNAVPQYTVMPAASSTNAGEIVQFVGTTSATYTNGYFYKNAETTTPASASVEQTAGSSLADLSVDYETFEEELDEYDIPRSLGTYAFVYDGADWKYDGTAYDPTDFGITFTGTPVADDAITVTYTAESTSYAWARVDVQPAGASYTAGTGISIDANNEISVAAPTLTNTATHTTSLGILGSTGSATHATSVGDGSSATYTGSVAIGRLATSSATGAIAIGRATKATANNAIQLGGYGAVGASNYDANTFKVCNANGNFEIMSADGTVPTARLTKVNTTATLAVADWSSSTQTVTVSGVAADSVVFVSPAPASASDYASAGILCTAQAANSLTFSCDTTPTNAITVNVICM